MLTPLYLFAKIIAISKKIKKLFCALHNKKRSAQKENVRNCYERFVVFVMVFGQAIELIHAANPTQAMQAPINVNIIFPPFI